MPEPLLYLKAMGAAAFVSAMVVLALAGVRRPATAMRLSVASILALGIGLAVGYFVLSLQLAWPPRNGLDRFLLLIVPAAFVIELLAACDRSPRWIVWLVRMIFATIIPRVLLHDSVYLSGAENGWPLWQQCLTVLVSGVLVAGVWVLLSRLSERSPGVSIPLALCAAIQCAGLTVMLAGYIKGGAAALPFVATLAATAISSSLIAKRSDESIKNGMSAILGIGVVGLFGLMFIGHYFGRLSTGNAILIMWAPLLCWATELPQRRHRNPWIVGSLRLVLVAIPLATVLFMAKCDFDRDMAPLLWNIPVSDFVQPN